MNKWILLTVIVTVYLSIPVYTLDIGEYTTINGVNLVQPSSSLVVGNGTFNESLTNLLYWRLDGSNAPPTADWNMDGKNMLFNNSIGGVGGKIQFYDEKSKSTINGIIEYLGSLTPESQFNGVKINSSAAVLIQSNLGTYITGGLDFLDNQTIGFGTGSFGLPDVLLYYNGSEDKLILEDSGATSTVHELKSDFNITSTGRICDSVGCIGTGDNVTWNESYANGKYAKYNFTTNNFNGTGNFTTIDTGFFGYLGSSITNILKGWFVDINASRVNTTTLCLSGNCKNGWDTYNESYDNWLSLTLGDGSDGVVVITSNTTLSRTMYYENLTIDANYSINPQMRDIFVRDTLTINGWINYDGVVGGNAVGSIGGPGAAPAGTAEEGNQGAGQPGANGGTGNGGIPSSMTVINFNSGVGGKGGNGGNGSRGNGTVVTTPSGANQSRKTFMMPGQSRYGAGVLTCGVGGGQGGGGGGNFSVAGGGGGGGGSSGGFIVISARVINITGNIRALGGNGGVGAQGVGTQNTGGGGGGGGAGGGCVYLFYKDAYYNTGVINVSGGMGGNFGIGTPPLGTNGFAGSDGQKGVAFKIDLKNKTWTDIS